jgi:nucleotide-binding universal stress UspA family protein
MILKRNSAIIIVIDFSKKSMNLIEQTTVLAKSLNARLILMFVCSESENQRNNEIIEITNKTKKDSGLDVKSIYISENIFKNITKKAIETDCGLIVFGLNNEVKLKPVFNETELYKFLKIAPCPVYTVNVLNSQLKYKNIFIHIDLTAESREKVGITVQLAKMFNSNINIISVFPPNNEQYENNILPYVNQVKKYIKGQGLNCSNKSICSKDVSDTIINYAINNSCDIIVQMNKQSLSLKEMIFGMCANEIIKKSSIPVLSINPMKRESISSGIH